MHAPLEDGELEGLVLGPELRKQPRLLVYCFLSAATYTSACNLVTPMTAHLTQLRRKSQNINISCSKVRISPLSFPKLVIEGLEPSQHIIQAEVISQHVLSQGFCPIMARLLDSQRTCSYGHVHRVWEQRRNQATSACSHNCSDVGTGGWREVVFSVLHANLWKN